jgi:hypothetical protein
MFFGNLFELKFGILPPKVLFYSVCSLINRCCQRGFEIRNDKEENTRVKLLHPARSVGGHKVDHQSRSAGLIGNCDSRSADLR